MDIKRGDIVYLNRVIPAEEHIQGGRRPYVVVSNDIGNYHSDFCVIVPLTSKINKKWLPTHAATGYHGSVCLCEQIFTVPQSAISEVVFHLPYRDMKAINRCLHVAFMGGR